MENKLGFLGKHNDTSIHLNMGKYGFYLIFDDKLYSVPACFQTDNFNLESAFKVTDYKSKLIKEEKKLEMDSTRNEVFEYLEIYLEIYEYGEVVQGVRFPDAMPVWLRLAIRSEVSFQNDMHRGL